MPLSSDVITQLVLTTKVSVSHGYWLLVLQTMSSSADVFHQFCAVHIASMKLVVDTGKFWSIESNFTDLFFAISPGVSVH